MATDWFQLSPLTSFQLFSCLVYLYSVGFSFYVQRQKTGLPSSLLLLPRGVVVRLSVFRRNLGDIVLFLVVGLVLLVVQVLYCLGNSKRE